MQTQLLSLRLLSDDELIIRVNSMAGKTREVSASLIAHLTEMETRELYLPLGFSSMFAYCTQVLRFSEHEAYGRIKAARVATRFPVVLDRLADGSLNMTAVMLLSPHLTPANHLELFAAARHKTRQEMEKLAAALRPLPAVSTMIRKLPAHPGRLQDSESLFPMNAGSGPEDLATPTAPLPIAATVSHLPAPTRPAILLALAPNRYKLQVTISESTQQKLRQAQELIRHQIPDGNTAEILDRALDLLVEKLRKQKFGGGGRKKHVTVSS
jgi:hypothetical protein